MKNDTLLGVLLGLLVASVSIGVNVWRADTNLVSTHPVLVCAMVVPAAVYFAVWRQAVAAVDPAILSALVCTWDWSLGRYSVLASGYSPGFGC